MIADDAHPSTVTPVIEPTGMALPVALPDDPAELKGLLNQLQATVAAQAQHILALQEHAQKLHMQHEQRIQSIHEQHEQRIQGLYEQLRLARRRLFGPSSESHAGQGWLFDEADAAAADTSEADDTIVLPAAVPSQPEAAARMPRRAIAPLRHNGVMPSNSAKAPSSQPALFRRTRMLFLA